MHLLQYESFKNAKEILQEKNQYEVIERAINNEDLNIQGLKHTESKKLIIETFLVEGWAYHPLVFDNMSSYMDLINKKTLLHIQFGHNAQVYFNILGAASMFNSGLIDVAVFIVPGKSYSYGNRVNYDKLVLQYEKFDNFLLVPLLVLEVE